MKKTISFSLYGSDPFYCDGAVKTVKYGKEKYPDWEWRYYIGDSVPKDTLALLESLGCNLVYMTGEQENNISMLWRFFASEDSDIAIFRDADSPILWRERWAVQEWLQSEKTLHCMRDNQHHHSWPIFGGMWGIKNKIADIKDMINRYPKEDRYILDMDFLRDKIWDIYKEDSISHISNENCHIYGDYIGRDTDRLILKGAIEADFPSIRKKEEFVGMRSFKYKIGY